MIVTLRYVFLLLVVQLAVACSPAAPSAEAPDNRPAANAETARQAEDARLVLTFGDSLYAGYQLEQNQGFAPALQRALEAQGIAARVVNGGVSGDTTAAARQRLAFTLDGLERRPDLVLVGLGGNDALRGLGPDETRANLAAILAELRQRDIPVLVTGMMAPRNMGPDYAARFDPIFQELAREHDAALYPFLLDGVITEPMLLLPDGIHPNADGVNAIVARLAPDVARLLGAP
ncbi:MAG: arylesterase [Sphingomonas sp.]|nr:arylesterase [Sphingomonas sp.]